MSALWLDRCATTSWREYAKQHGKSSCISPLWETNYTRMIRRWAWQHNHLVGDVSLLEVPEEGGLVHLHSHRLTEDFSLRGKITINDSPRPVDEHGQLPMVDVPNVEEVAGVGEVVARALFGDTFNSFTKLSSQLQLSLRHIIRTFSLPLNRHPL